MRRPGWARATPYHGAVDAWDAKRLRLVLATALVLVLVTVAWGFYAILTHGQDREQHAAAAPAAHPVAELSPGPARRDAVAAAPMLKVPPLSLQDAAPDTAAADVSPIQIPAAEKIGPAQIPTGYPHTPEGAVGQLASLTTAVIQRMSLPYTQEVYGQWSAPGAPDVTAWPITANIRSFLGRTRMGATKSADATIIAFPVAAQVKGADGPDWQVPCVLLDIRATNRDKEQRTILYGYCERMQWQAGRWVIAPGAPAAAAPATWPGTTLSATAGWRPWGLAGEHQD